MSSNDKAIINKMIKYCKDSVKYININSLEFEEFTNNELYLTFSIFALSQLGELAAKVSEEMKAEFNEIPWNAIKSMRNKIVHDYDGVRYKVIWDTL
ncbi:MAG: DUF86 domain-containing protein [Firmicutes bacterium]|nr:DUF86 domain-containing protein [Bacillota bacterium]